MPTCQHCRGVLTDEAAAQAKTCPHCGQSLVVPEATPEKPRTVANFPDHTLVFEAGDSGQKLPASPPPAESAPVTARNMQTLVPDSPQHAGEAGSVKQCTVAVFPDHTLDLSTDRPPAAPPPRDRNSQTLQHDSTVSDASAADTGFSVDQPPPTKPATLSDRQILATMESASASQFGEKLDDLWGKSATPSSPYVTMRGSSQSSGEVTDKSTLVIRERALRGKTNLQISTADYDLIEVLGEGGMGVVYTARQASVDREVAVKMLRPEMLENENQRRKFLSEAVVTGELDHPNIVPIYDVGQNADGALFYSMKKVQGTPWSKTVETNSLIANLDILLKVADAVAFAHARGVIHRDLKPENIMLGDFGEVLVLDWGLAVATEGHRPTPNVATEFGIAGTPAYMSPELAMGPLDLIGKASDLYLLGAILYEIITGKPPHQGKDAMDCLRAAARNDIVPTEKRGELVDIALKAMRTDIDERYPSVRALQEAIRDYQSHSESIALSERAQQDLQEATLSDDYRQYARALLGFEEAHKLWSGNETALAGISRAKTHYAGSAHRKHDYDLGLSLIDQDNPDHAEVRQLLLEAKRERDARQGRLKAARRAMIGLIAAVFLAVSVGIVLTTIMKFEADKQRDIAQEQKIEADKQRDIAKTEKAEAVRQRANAEAQEIVAGKQRDEANRQKGLAIAARRQAEYEAYVALISMAAAKIDENAFGLASQALAACQQDLRGWEWGRLSHVIAQSAGKQLPVSARVECLAASANGRMLAVGGRDGSVRLWQPGEAGPGRVVYQASEPQASIHALAFSPTDANLLAIGSNIAGKWLQLLNLETGVVRPLAGPQGHSGAVVHLAFSRDGARLLTASHDHTAKLWNVAAGEPAVTYKGHSWLVWSAIFSLDPAEKYVATASEDGTVRLWETATGKEWVSPTGEPIPFTGHHGPVYSIDFLPAETAAPTNTTAPSTLGSLPNIGHLASAGYDKRILMWQPQQLVPFDFKKLLAEDAVPQTPFVEFAGHTAAVRDIAFSPDGAKLLSASSDNSLRVWYARDMDLGYATVRRGKLDMELRGHDGPVQTALFVPGRPDEIASAGFDRTVRLWNLRQYQEERSLPARALRGHVDAVMAARFSADGQNIFTASRDRTAKKWSLAAGRESLTFREGHAYLTSKAIFFPAGDRLLTAAVDGTVRVWNVSTGAELFKITGTGYRSTAALSRDGKWILTGSDREVLVVDSGDDFAGRREGAVLWDAATGQRVRVFPGHKVPITAVAFSDDGALAFTGDENGVGHLWQAATGEHLAKIEFHLGPITAALFTPNSQRLLTASVDKSVCQWDLSDQKRPAPLASLTLKHPATVNALALTPDGQRVLTGGEDGSVRLWELSTARQVWLVEATSKPGDDVNSAASINAVAISPKDGDSVALAVDSVQQLVRLFELNTGREILLPTATGQADHFLNLRSKDALGWSAAFSPDGAHVVTVGGDEARLWDRQGVEVASFGPHRPLTFIGVSPDDKIAATAGWDNTARLWNAQTGAPLITLDGNVAGPLGAHTAVINSAVFSPDAAQLLTASDDGTLRLWDIAQGRVLKVLRCRHGGVTKALFLNDGRRIVASFRGDAGGAIAGIWELASLPENADLPAPALEFKGHTAAILDIALSSDNRYLVTGGADNSARVWNAASGEFLLSLEGHSGEVTAVAFAPDARQPRILTGAADRTAKLWDVSAIQNTAPGQPQPSAKELLTLRGHSRGVTSVAFSPDGQSALTASRDGLAIVWSAEPWGPVKDK